MYLALRTIGILSVIFEPVGCLGIDAIIREAFLSWQDVAAVKLLADQLLEGSHRFAGQPIL